MKPFIKQVSWFLIFKTYKVYNWDYMPYIYIIGNVAHCYVAIDPCSKNEYEFREREEYGKGQERFRN
jgi:hypothetical protein